jgi:PAS domain S-box-containing protein
MMIRVSIFWKFSAVFVIIILLVLVASQNVGLLTSSGLLQAMLVLALAVAVSCGLAWFVVNAYVKRPVRGLIDGMNRLAEREYDFRLDEDETGELGAFASSFNDMASMLSSSLTELKKNQDYLQSILESSADIIITVTPSGNVQTMNKGAEAVLGYSRLEVIGKPIQMFFADPREREAAIEQLKYSDSVVNYETRFVTKSGETRNVLLTLSRLRNSAGEIIGTIGISKDITEETRLQAKLIQSQRLAAIGEVFTGIQHSMKNMLNACKGGAYMVKTGLSTDNRTMLVEGWEMVQEGITRLTDMSTDMLKYVKEWVPRSQRVDLTEILSEIYRVVKQTAADNGVALQLDICPQLPAIACDAKMIHSAVMDVVSNALDACLWKDYSEEETPEILMKAYPNQDNSELVIEIKDNGCGMSEDVKANIFTPFFSTKSKAGTGLGLSLTSRAVGVHGGKIDVESEPERGATFRIVLPVDGPGKK